MTVNRGDMIITIEEMLRRGYVEEKWVNGELAYRLTSKGRAWGVKKGILSP